jgi:hypothetical protein
MEVSVKHYVCITPKGRDRDSGGQRATVKRSRTTPVVGRLLVPGRAPSGTAGR